MDADRSATDLDPLANALLGTGVPHVDTPSGAVLVLTASGSQYRFDLAAGTVRRVRADAAGLPAFPMRRDDEDVPVRRVDPVVIGSPVTMLLELREDGVPTLRTTNEVVSVSFAAPHETLAVT